MLETKTFHAKANVEDEAKGLVQCVVSVFGNVDCDGERLVKGAFARSIKAAKDRGRALPPGVWYHDLKQPVARTLEAYEGDDGLHVLGKFNLKTSRGHDAFWDVAEEVITQYSFGFDQAQKARKGGAVEISDLRWLEWSPVTLAANDQTYTAGVKALRDGMPFAEHSTAVLAAVEELIGRADEIKELRAKEGRVLSGESRDRLQAIQGRLTEFLAACEDPDARAYVDIEVARYLQTHSEFLRLTAGI